MLFTMHLSYKVDEKHQKLVMQKLREYSHALVTSLVAGALTDMSILERTIEFEFGKSELTLSVDTFGVDLEPEEQEQVEMTMRESYIAFFDSPVTKDNTEIWIDDIEATVTIAESQADD